MKKTTTYFDVQQNKSDVQEIVENLTLFDDDLMSRVFDKNIPATELFLSIVLNRRIKVISVKGQYNIKSSNINGRSITLDILAIDENKQLINIEVQSSPKGAHIRRARFHSSVLDSRMLRKKQDFKELKDSYVIFMYAHDKFGKGAPIYHINRYIEETGEPFGDGSHIIYVNGNYQGDDSIGRLISDFHQTKSDKMHFKELADGVKHFKETDGENEVMCEAVEKYAKKYAKAYADKREGYANTNAVSKLMSEMKMTLEQAMDFLALNETQRIFVTKQLSD